MCEARLAIEDEKAVQRLVRNFTGLEIWLNEFRAKFVDHMKGRVAKTKSE